MFVWGRSVQPAIGWTEWTLRGVGHGAAGERGPFTRSGAMVLSRGDMRRLAHPVRT
jgi:hypothetical protein